MKKIFKLTFLIGILMLMCSCAGKQEEANSKDAYYKFNFSADLNKFLDKEKIIDNIKNGQMGADGPYIAYANNNYAAVVNYNGILIYNINDNNICGAIDNKALGMSDTQGDNAVQIKGNDKYIFICCISDESSGYVYSPETNEMARAENVKEDVFNYGQPVEDTVMKKISDEYISCDNGGFSACMTKDKAVVFEHGYGLFESWKLFTIPADSLK